jgi:hypothetical protein
VRSDGKLTQVDSTAPRLDYRPPRDERAWALHVDGAEVTLSFPARPAWQQYLLTLASVAFFLGIAIGSGIFAGRQFVLGVRRIPAVLAGVFLTMLFGRPGMGYASELVRLLRFGPQRHLVRLTSRPLATAVDPELLARQNDIFVVSDALHVPGALKPNGRRERLLHLPAVNGIGLDLVWRGKPEHLDELARELRQVLRLNS